MMSDMAVSKAERARAGATPEFVALCKTLYGELVDADVIWDEVIKSGPDQADLHANTGTSMRRRFEQGSNVLGLTAAGMATGQALRDERLKEGGKILRGLYATGRKIPSPISSKGGKVGAALAAGALGTQAVNMGGDVAINRTLAQKEKQPTSKAMPKLDDVAEGFRRLHRGMLKTVTASGPTPGTPPAKAELAQRAVTRADRAAGRPTSQAEAMGNAKANSNARKAGNDVGRMLSTTSGKVLAGGAGLAGAHKLGGSLRQRSQGAQGAYVPDAYAYGKRDEQGEQEGTVEWAGEFSKFDDDKHLAFGWASVVKANGQPVVDRQGDYISPEDIEDAAYAYVHKSRVGGDMHRRNGQDAHKVSDLVESMVFTDDKIAKMGLPDDFPRGWWVGYKVHDPVTWDLVRKGERTGFSIHGKGIRKDHDLDELMGYTA